MGDIEEVFLNGDEFAEPVTIRYKSGVVVQTFGIFDNDYVSVDPNVMGPVQSQNPRIAVATIKLSHRLGPNDWCIIRGKNYRVIEAHDDGTGITDIFFQHNTHEDTPSA